MSLIISGVIALIDLDPSFGKICRFKTQNVRISPSGLFRKNPFLARSLEFGVSKQGYLTLLLRKDLLGTIMLLEKEREAVIDSTVAMNKIGVNLNQIAHALNILVDDREKRSIPFKELKLQIAKLSSFIENHLYKMEKILKSAKTRTNIKM
jgi:hypothetical protein